MNGKRVAAIFGLALGLLAGGARGQVSTGDGSSTQDQAELQLRDQEQRKLKAVVAKKKIDDIAGEARGVATLLDKLSKRLDVLQPKLDELMTNDDGRRVAMSDSVFLFAMDLQSQPLVTREQITSKASSIQAIIDALGKADASTGVVPPTSMADEIADAKQWAKDSLSKMEGAESTLDGAVKQIPANMDLRDKPTLKERIDAYRIAQVEALNQSRLRGEHAAQTDAQQRVADAARVAELLRAQEESDRLLRETRAQLERQRIENEMQLAKLKDEQAERESALQRQLAQAQAQRTTAAAQNDAITQKAAQDADLVRKRQLCHDKDVVATLSPFLAKGYLQPKSGRGIEQKPMSLSELRAGQALEPTKEGIQKLMVVANNPKYNDRPTWGHFMSLTAPKNTYQYVSPENLEMVKKAQKYLVDYGDALVAEGMLSP